MTYVLRDRPDGQIEIAVLRPVVVGVFPDADYAYKFVAFLKVEEPELVDDTSPEFDLPDDPDDDLTVLIEVSEPIKKRVEAAISAAFPVPAALKPKAPALIPRAPSLSQEDRALAFSRIGDGEKIGTVAVDFGVTMFEMRGMWAQYRYKLQKELAEGGQQNCVLCTKKFTPSMSHPDRCARCSHD